MTRWAGQTCGVFLAVALAASAGCLGGQDAEPDPLDDPTEASPGPSDGAGEPLSKPRQDDQPAFVHNSTLSFHALPEATANDGGQFDLPQRAARLFGNASVIARDFCRHLHGEAASGHAWVEFLPPDDSSPQEVPLSDQAECQVSVGVLEEIVFELPPVPGNWSVVLRGRGNVDVTFSLGGDLEEPESGRSFGGAGVFAAK